MTEKFTDLYDPIMEAFGTDGAEPWDVLVWLDDNRDQAPGPTILSSQAPDKVRNRNGDYSQGFLDGIEAVGGKIVPVHQPTNVEKLAEKIRGAGLYITPDKVDQLARDLDDDGVEAP